MSSFSFFNTFPFFLHPSPSNQHLLGGFSVHAFTLKRTVILGKSHYILYGLVAAMQPRMLVTFDEELRPLPVSVRVGQVTLVTASFH